MRIQSVLQQILCLPPVMNIYKEENRVGGRKVRKEPTIVCGFLRDKNVTFSSHTGTKRRALKPVRGRGQHLIRQLQTLTARHRAGLPGRSLAHGASLRPQSPSTEGTTYHTSLNYTRARFLLGH